jgi:hypothetical protein
MKMACLTKFEKGLDFNCVKCLIDDVRSGSVSTHTIQTGLWIVGCGVEFFDDKSSPVIGDANLTEVEMCDQIEANLNLESFGAKEEEEVKAIDPALIWMIAQLVWSLLKKRK